MLKFTKLLSKLAIALCFCFSALPAGTQQFAVAAQQTAPSKIEKQKHRAIASLERSLVNFNMAYLPETLLLE
jgi:hypothetical protein